MDPVTMYVGMAILDMGFQMFGAGKAAKARKRAEARMRAAVQEEQRIWDRDVGPISRAYNSFLKGTETGTQQRAREGQAIQVAEGQMRLAGSAIGQNTRAAGQSLSSNFAARGMGTSGVMAQAATDLESARLSTLGDVRATSLNNATNQWQQGTAQYLSMMGKRPSMAQAEMGLMSQYSTDQTIDTSAVVNSLMRLASKTPGTTSVAGDVNPDLALNTGVRYDYSLYGGR